MTPTNLDMLRERIAAEAAARGFEDHSTISLQNGERPIFTAVLRCKMTDSKNENSRHRTLDFLKWAMGLCCEGRRAWIRIEPEYRINHDFSTDASALLGYARFAWADEDGPHERIYGAAIPGVLELPAWA